MARSGSVPLLRRRLRESGRALLNLIEFIGDVCLRSCRGVRQDRGGDGVCACFDQLCWAIIAGAMSSLERVGMEDRATPRSVRAVCVVVLATLIALYFAHGRQASAARSCQGGYIRFSTRKVLDVAIAAVFLGSLASSPSVRTELLPTRTSATSRSTKQK